MKKVVAFLLCVLIFVSPVTTLVKADVVIGDNDETIINENAVILGRKIALMESLSDLALSGVTEFTISNTNDVDSYLDSLWTELNDAIESLSDGTGFTEISNDLKSRYFTNLVQYQDYINNRGVYFANMLPSGSPTTNLLSTFFANNIFGKHSTLHNNLSLNTFRALSRAHNQSPTPSPDDNYSFIDNLQFIKGRTTENTNDIRDLNSYSVSQIVRAFDNASLTVNYSVPVSYCGIDLTNYHTATIGNSTNILTATPCVGIGSIYLTTNSDNSINAHYVNCTYNTHPINNWNTNVSLQYVLKNNYLGCQTTGTTPVNYLQDNFSNLSDAINYVYKHYAYINLYVDNVPWAIVSDDSLNVTTLDIDGFLKLYGQNQPVQYELQPNTQIDYDQLYQVIYTAIRDNLPISQSDINYYDSHDTIYSPTIINNYGDEEGEESDLIDTILDYAVIPKFDTAIAQPMRSALTNGVVIMNTSITNVIPDEILLILGACFFLLLFAVVINRMIK